ncbi:Probable GTP-binding protein HflX [Mycobacteroides abscessus subsp. bolletii]|uniref:GTPase HflX n=6 Tax=Mycobacteroides abscessus TaxID=36809 RepID=A0A9Q7SF52_9MYCO|nr:Probable GTP-binding protein HflX [Mycobacteroides abscessus]SHO99679.1 Probable GTP-binding protein HflX [Mycobacteroides abscessus subsp. bolletii]SHR73892.1 Probable GTP-binding protein HflX [Mycobacteroides abscessus subsp. bolletii]SHS10589.1 Probable GTP-binding protein HflX [Mycobacteroides abscessus subsp. bolletii]SHT38916.1 GTP-binding protein HflX [Mycobacteroides abscessus subsp. bolletii]
MVKSRTNGGAALAPADNSDAFDEPRVGASVASMRTTYETPTDGELALEDRAALKRVAGLSTELADVTEVEYRQLRLERVVLVGVWTEGTSQEAEASMTELAALAETAGSEVLEGLIQRRQKPDPATYIGSGKAIELREIVLATGADTVICDGELSPAQLVALEKAVKVKVIDRTALILDIFAQHATSREGKAQVSLAQMEYMLPRLRGWGESMSRQAGGRAGGAGGGVGTRGPGETKIETDRRRIRERMSKLRREIRDMKKVRDTKRSRRLESDVPSVAIVGYTNAGKSSLLNAITGAGVLVQDALFATLEPTTRRGTFDDGREFVITDTVGFVRHLPTQLVEAFRSTLEEVADADLLVHVVDGSDMAPLAQIEAVRTVIGEVVADHDASAAPELLVINKVDAAGDLALAQLRRALPKALFVSAHTGEGIATLREAIAEAVPRGDVPVDVVIPYERGDLVARIHTEGQVQSTEHLADGTRVVGRVPRALAAVLTAL